MRKLILFLLLVSGDAFSQTGAALIQYFPGVPTGTCTIGRTLAMDQTTGHLYACVSGVWTLTTGGGGGAGLNGCQTSTPGNLTCNSSMAVTATGGGTLQLANATLPAPPTTTTGELTADASGVPWWSPGSNAAFTQLATTAYVSGAVSGMLTVNSFSACNMMGWSNNAQTCADLQANTPATNPYTVSIADNNRVIINRNAGAVTNVLPAPIGTLAAPFDFWVDTNCISTVTLQAGTGALLNGHASYQIGACGWAHIWADANGTDWHAQIYNPPGGVIQIQ